MSRSRASGGEHFGGRRLDSEPKVTMSLVRPIMKVIQQVARPALKATGYSRGSLGRNLEGQIGKELSIDPAKLDWAAREVLAELRRIFEVEGERRGF